MNPDLILMVHRQRQLEQYLHQRRPGGVARASAGRAARRAHAEDAVRRLLGAPARALASARAGRLRTQPASHDLGCCAAA